MNIGYGWIDVRENKKACYVSFIKHQTLRSVGIYLKLDRKKVNMMVHEHVTNITSKMENEPFFHVTSFRCRSCPMVSITSNPLL